MLSEDAPNSQNIIACVVYSRSAVLYLVMMCVKLIIDVLSLVFSTCFFCFFLKVAARLARRLR